MKLTTLDAFAFAGKFDLVIKEEIGSHKSSITNILLHPDWNFNDLKYDADIAIIVLRTEVDYSEGIQPICLPPSSTEEVTGVGTVVGWGKNEASGSFYHATVPSKLDVPAINSSHCYTTFNLGKFSSNRAFCGGYENQGKAPCLGDSGGGFYLKQEAKWSVRGIVSDALVDEEHGCDINKFSLYTNVARFIDWIEKSMLETKEIIWQLVELHCEEKDRIM